MTSTAFDNALGRVLRHNLTHRNAIASPALCPELLGACPNHPVCGDLEPLTQSARCRRSPCNGVHSGDGQDAWTSEGERA